MHRAQDKRSKTQDAPDSPRLRAFVLLYQNMVPDHQNYGKKDYKPPGKMVHEIHHSYIAQYLLHVQTLLKLFSMLIIKYSDNLLLNLWRLAVYAW